MRILLHIFLPLFLPIVIYTIWAKIDANRKGKGLPSWENGHWFWVIIAGFVFTACSLIFLTTLGNRTDGHYQSPKIENGVIVPGHYK